MIVYTDKEDKIVAYGETTDIEYKNRVEINGMFENKCDEYIFGYKCIPHYKCELDSTGQDKIVNGKPQYILDENGNKTVDGASVYPWEEYYYIKSVQKSYEDSLVQMADLIGGAYE